MNAGIGEGRTRADHRNVADQLYSFYAQALDLRRLVAIVGEAALSEEDRLLLNFADAFETRFVTQEEEEDRSIRQTLDIAWDLLSMFSPDALKRVKQDYIACYHCVI
jgi:V/A-type H+-transporting ATPase subunit B